MWEYKKLFVLSLLVLFIGVLIYIFIGRSQISERKLFLFQCAYILFYFCIVPYLHVNYKIIPPDHYYDDIEQAFFQLNIINIFSITFMIGGLILGVIISKNIKIIETKEVDWLLLRKLGLIYIFFSTLYLSYMIASGNYFYQEVKSELAENGNSLISYIILESTPLIVCWVMIANMKIKESKNFWLYFILFIIISILFSGVRGSRIAVIFQVINFILLYGFLINKISIKKIIIFLIIGWSFNSLFSAYKYGGIDGLEKYITTGERPVYLASRENESLSFIVFDLGRSNIQAKILENYLNNNYKPPNYPYTYFSALNLLIPKNFRFDIEDKRVLGTEAQYGFKGNEDYSSSRIYGLLGESILNFGLKIFFLIFFIYGLVHLLTINIIEKIKRTRYALFIPFFFFIPIYLLFYDLDNIVFQIVKNWLIPFIIFLLVFRARVRK